MLCGALEAVNTGERAVSQCQYPTRSIGSSHGYGTDVNSLGDEEASGGTSLQ